MEREDTLNTVDVLDCESVTRPGQTVQDPVSDGGRSLDNADKERCEVHGS